MNLHPTSLQSRLLANLLLVGLTVAVFEFAIVPIRDVFQAQRDSFLQAQHFLEEYRRRTEPLPPLQAKLDELRNRQHSETGFIEGTNMAMGSAALQATSKRVMESNGGILRSIQVLPAVPDGDATRVIVRIDGSVPSQRLLDFLYDIRTLVPYVFIDNLDIRAPEATNAAAQASLELTIRADLYGYIRTAVP